MKFFTLTFFILLFSIYSSNAQEIREIRAFRTENNLNIDGILEEEVWTQAIAVENFTQMEPFNGKPASLNSKVKILYDDYAIYIGAELFDNNPDSIITTLTRRDEFTIFDHFGLYFDPYNDGQTGYGFFVSAAGVQFDMLADDNGNEDSNWNAVWFSNIQITENGWTVEMKIPYSAIRFPNKPQQTWGVNFFRNIQRYRENSSWNFIDNEKHGFINQNGKLVGIENIVPPFRLSVTPYISLTAENYSDSHSWAKGFKGGMDLKYGISESFTLDMMLIPDFGQVQSDDERLNTTPFEVFYDERRSFFMEGSELFDLAGIFYSRRIGGRPINYYEVENSLNENEIITENRNDAQLINATKISGKTKQGLSIGFLNAMSLKTEAIVKDTITNIERIYETQPFTNFNLVVFDQALKNNSSIGFINTNVSRADNLRNANVTGSQIRLFNKNNSYLLAGSGAYNHITLNDSTTNGYYYDLSISKVSGKFRSAFYHHIESEEYNPNDMGFLMNPNEMNNIFTLSYNVFEPRGRTLNKYISTSFYINHLFNPRKFISFLIYNSGRVTFKNYLSMGYNLNIYPIERNDFFEAREDGRKLILPAQVSFGNWYSSDYRKVLALDINGGFWKTAEMNLSGTWFTVSPRFKPGNRMLIIYSFTRELNKNEIGYVAHSEDNNDIFMGNRKRQTIVNVLSASYIFTNRMSLTFRARHYWSIIDYHNFYTLNTNGYLTETNLVEDNNNHSFNAFTVDMVYTWNFAPGSEILLVWKNAITEANDELKYNYFDNTNRMFETYQTNTFSFKLLYYIDYLYLKKLQS